MGKILAKNRFQKATAAKSQTERELEQCMHDLATSKSTFSAKKEEVERLRATLKEKEDALDARLRQHNDIETQTTEKKQLHEHNTSQFEKAKRKLGETEEAFDKACSAFERHPKAPRPS